MTSYIGKALKRREDERFLRGQGTYVDDVVLPDMAHAAFVRSPHGQAKILGFATDKAKVMPGVLAVLTSEDWKEAGLGGSPCLWDLPQRTGEPMRRIMRPILTTEQVRHVGDTVALVVAESPVLARSAAEAVEVDYKVLPANADTARALDADTAILHEDHGTNLAFDWEVGDEKATEAAFAGADHVTRLNSPLTKSSLDEVGMV